MALTKQQNKYLSDMGIERWYLRKPQIPSSAPNVHAQLETLQEVVRQCRACGLCETRKQTVFGQGALNAKLMFIGEAPGAEEDKQGKPFVGRAGQLLTQMLKAVKLTREEVFIANILKCRPPNNRDPSPEEVTQCTKHLQQQIALIQPKLLVALGRISAHYLLNTKTALTRLRGQLFEYNYIPLLVTFHPAYLLRYPQDKAKAYEDLKKMKHFLDKIPS